MNNGKERGIKLCMWESGSCVSNFFIYILQVYIFTVCMHSCLFLNLHLSAFDLNEMHLDTYNFIMPCNNISLCDGKQAERGRTQRWDGGVGASMRVVFDIMLE